MGTKYQCKRCGNKYESPIRVSVVTCSVCSNNPEHANKQNLMERKG